MSIGIVRLGLGWDVYCLADEGEFTPAYKVWDLRGNTTVKDSMSIYDSYHFEVTFDEEHLSLGHLMVTFGGCIGQKANVELRVDFDPTTPRTRSRSFVDGWEPRWYSYESNYQVFWGSAEGNDVLGFAFGVQNTQMRRDKPKPQWELAVGDGRWYEMYLPRYKEHAPSPLNPYYGADLMPYQRGQGEPFWYLFRSGAIVIGTLNGYRLVAKISDRVPLRGGSSAYKNVGKFYDGGSDRVASTYKMRMGTNLESLVLVMMLKAFPKITIHEYGWRRGVKFIEGLGPAGQGGSPDGIITDPDMKLSCVPGPRLQHWAENGVDLGHLPDFNVGLLEIKVTDGVLGADLSDPEPKMYTEAKMCDYYLMQITWCMMKMDLMWTRVAKLNLNGGNARAYLVYRDYNKENALLAALRAVHEGVDVKKMSFKDAVNQAVVVKYLKMMTASAKWHNNNPERCSVDISAQYKCSEVSSLLHWRKKVRQEAVLDPRDRLTEKYKPRVVKRVVARDEEAVAREKLVGRLDKAHRQMTSSIRQGIPVTNVVSTYLSTLRVIAKLPPNTY